MQYVRVANTADIEEGQGRVAEVEGHVIAVFQSDGRFYAIHNICPHRGGALGDGVLDGPVVSCPWHGWDFNIQTGACLNRPGIRVACYRVKIENGEILVGIPEGPSEWAE